MGSENIALIRNIRSVESVRVGGNRSVKENTASRVREEQEMRFILQVVSRVGN